MNEQELDNLACEIFRTFARLEGALKAAGFHCGDGDAMVNWQRFAESVSDLFDDPEDERLEHAIAYIWEHPPKKQIVLDGVLTFEETAPGTNLKSAEQVLIYVRRVRNNLFHGGKVNALKFEPQRSKELLDHSLVILWACIDELEDVRGPYDRLQEGGP